MTLARMATIGTLALSLAACATVQKARDRIIKAPVSCVDQTVQIYFEPESAELTREGKAVINAAAGAARGCKVTSVEVLGLADSAGPADANLELSKRRAQSVTAALASAGLPAAEFRIAAAGDAGATTAGGQSRPLRRRADITLHLSK